MPTANNLASTRLSQLQISIRALTFTDCSQVDRELHNKSFVTLVNDFSFE